MVNDSVEEIIANSKRYAEQAGLKLNPDERIVEGIAKGLFMNKEKHGEIYCPCRRVTGGKEEDKKIICPCVYHLNELARDGHCHCRLFVK